MLWLATTIVGFSFAEYLRRYTMLVERWRNWVRAKETLLTITEKRQAQDFVRAIFSLFVISIVHFHPS
jgi:hypothetical protein